MKVTFREKLLTEPSLAKKTQAVSRSLELTEADQKLLVPKFGRTCRIPLSSACRKSARVGRRHVTEPMLPFARITLCICESVCAELSQAATFAADVALCMPSGVVRGPAPSSK